MERRYELRLWKLAFILFCVCGRSVHSSLLSKLETRVIGDEEIEEGDILQVESHLHSHPAKQQDQQQLRVHAVEKVKTKEGTRPMPNNKFGFDTTTNTNLKPTNYDCDYLPLNGGHNEWDDDQHKLKKVHKQKTHICGPRVLIIGAMKCGTNTIGHLLAKHPRVMINRCRNTMYKVRGQLTRNKEDCNSENFQGSLGPAWGFWEGNDLRYQNHSDTWLDSWTQRLPWTDGIHNISIDKSPSNLNTFKHPEIPEMAYDLLPNAKVVVTLCKPSTRMYSEFEYHMVSKRHYHLENEFDPYGKKVPDNFLDFARANLQCLKHAEKKYENSDAEEIEHCERLLSDYLRIGEYARHLQPWFEYYGKDNVLVVDMEDDAETKVAALLSHIGEDVLPPDEYPWEELKDDGKDAEEFFTNDAYAGRNSILLEHPSIIHQLEYHFVPFNEVLATMIGANFPLTWNNQTSN